MNNLIKRSLTGAIFIAVVILSILWHEITFLSILCVIVVLSNIEYYQISRKIHGRPLIAWQIILSLFLIISTFLVIDKIFPISFIALIIPLIFLTFITELYRRKRRAIINLALTFLPVIHIAAPLSMLIALAFMNGVYDYKIIMAMLIFTWTNDTFAYLTGVSIGKNKIMPRVSPKKTWEGFFGGLIAVIALAIYFTKINSTFTINNWIIIGVIVSIFGTFGDFVESMLKRVAGIKDSGNILPGHGGILDRFDSFLFATPFVFTYVFVFIK